MIDIALILSSVIRFYSILIMVYVLMSWVPVSGIFSDIQRVLGTLVEPYLGLFRRFIPPIGMIDVSPLVAYFVLQLVGSALIRML